MSVLVTYATGVALTVLVALAWIAVQGAWRRAFPDPLRHADGLSGRPGCGGAATPCVNRAADGTCRREEERR